MKRSYLIIVPGEADVYLTLLEERGATITASDREFGLVSFEADDDLADELRGRGVELTADAKLV